MPTSTSTQRTDGHESPPVIDPEVLRRERELSDRWKPDWHNARRTDPPASNGEARPASVASSLGLVTLTLSVEEIDAVLDRLDGSIGCANPVLCEAVAILMGARARLTPNTVAPVAPAMWGVR